MWHIGRWCLARRGATWLLQSRVAGRVTTSTRHQPDASLLIGSQCGACSSTLRLDAEAEVRDPLFVDHLRPLERDAARIHAAEEAGPAAEPAVAGMEL